MRPADDHVRQAIHLIGMALGVIKGLNVSSDSDNFYENEVVKMGFFQDRYIFEFENLYAEWREDFPNSIHTNIRISPRSATRMLAEAVDSIEKDTMTPNVELRTEAPIPGSSEQGD